MLSIEFRRDFSLHCVSMFLEDEGGSQYYTYRWKRQPDSMDELKLFEDKSSSKLGKAASTLPSDSSASGTVLMPVRKYRSEH